ncbi:MAG: epoxyqueuosine reductase QueH [Alphaproteobacteria bacterium]|nr:epoxyqueuosine reductase QueH [Alphaproteobacteria bacterium]
MPTQNILLLSCCAPCACAVIKKLKDEKQNFTVAFYNPNIHPKAEYEKRRDEQKRLCTLWNIPFVELPYEPDVWLAAASLYKDEPERGKRCSICFELRLKKVMQYAKENNFTAVASVLGVSRYKDLNQVNTAANRASVQTDIPYLEIEGRKHGMQQARLDLIKELNLYNQTYCGCIYSKEAALRHTPIKDLQK